MTHGKDIPGLLMRAETAARIMSEYEAWEPPVPPPVDPVDYAWTAQVITDLVAALRPAADPKAEGRRVLKIGDLVSYTPMENWPGGPNATARVVSLNPTMCRDVRLDDPAPPTLDAERAGEPTAWRWRYIYPKGPGGWHLRASMVEATPSTEWECEREVEPLYASPQSPATEAVRDHAAQLAKLVAFFNEPAAYSRWGRDGDHDFLRPADTAIRALRAALIRPPVNNSPEPERVVADVSKAAADTEGATKP